MIRRLFWLGLGAILGVTGYRRAAMFARSFAPVPRRGGRPAPGAAHGRGRAPAAGPGRGPARRASLGSWALAAWRFAADVREGMGLYMERHQSRAPNTLRGQQADQVRTTEGAGRVRRTDHLEDGR